MTDAARQLRHADTRPVGPGTRVVLHQEHRGVRILHAGVTIGLDGEGTVYHVSATVYPDLDVDVTPSLAPGAAVAAAQADLRASTVEVWEGPELVVWVDREGGDLTPHLAYHLQVMTETPLQAYEYTIGAESGAILRKVSLIRDLHTHGPSFSAVNPIEVAWTGGPVASAVEGASASNITGSGLVYATNPLHSAPVSRLLYGLRDLSPRQLDGENIVVYRHGSTSASSSNAVFNYDPSDARFDEVMVYRHGDAFERWLVGIGHGQLKVGKVTAQTRYPSNWYAFAIPARREMYFEGARPDLGLANPTHEAAVVAHEYMHIVSETYNTLNQNTEAHAMDEGYSDYFGIAYRHAEGGVSSTVIGEYIEQRTWCTRYRDVNNTAHYSQFVNGEDIDGSCGVSPHDGGMILAGALWAARSAPGVTPATADAIALSSLALLGTYPTFLDGRNAAVSAAQAHGQTYTCAVRDAFAARGIGAACPTFSVAITGPVELYVGQHGTWAAQTSGSPGPFTYEWFVMSNDPMSPGQWVGPVSTADTYTTRMYDFDGYLRIRVNVRKGSELQSAQTYVDCLDCSPGGGDGPMAQVAEERPAAFALHAPSPNPITDGHSLTVRYDLPERVSVLLAVYDLLGREVGRLADGEEAAGYHRASLEVGALPSGVYVVRLVAGAYVSSHRITVVR